jgi:hypothetical protein
VVENCDPTINIIITYLLLLMKISIIAIVLNFLYAITAVDAVKTGTLKTDAVKLEYNLKVGDVYEMQQQTNQNIKQTIMGMDQNGTSEYSGTMLMKVKSTTSDNSELETQFVKLRNSSKTLMGDNTMDSEGDQENPQNKVFKSMMNKTFTIILKKDGTIEKVSGTENLWADVDKLGLEEATVKAMREAMEQFMSESSLRKSLGQSMVRYSDKKEKVGDTWTSKSDFPMDFPIEINNVWKLSSHSGSTATVDANGVYTTIDADRIVTLPGGFKAKVNLAGTQIVNAVVKDKSGWSDLTSIQSNLKGKMILQAGGMIPTDMEIPMEITTKTSYTMVKK